MDIRIVSPDLRGLIATMRGGPAKLDTLVRKFMRRSATIARAGFKRNFATAGATFGQAWPPVADASLERYRRRYRGRLPSGAGRPMVLTGRLQNEVSARRGSRVTSNALVMAANTRGKQRQSLIVLHEQASGRLPVRRVRHPVTGLAGAPLAAIERGWQLLGDELARDLERGI